MPAGGQLGSGDLDLVFAPFTIARTSTGTVDVTYVNDPITGAPTTTHVPFCGEGSASRPASAGNSGRCPGVDEGEENLAAGGIWTRTAIRNFHDQDHQERDAADGNRNGAVPVFPVPCGILAASAIPIQLKDGTYRVKVELKVGKKLKTKVVRVNMDECTFTPECRSGVLIV